MSSNIIISSNLTEVDWQLVADIYKSVHWGQRGGRERIIESFANVKFKCFAYHNGKLVGFGKMMSDGVMYGAIYDVVVHSDYHGLGIGKRIMSWLVNEGSGLHWITLFASPGKESFYSKLGFKVMKTAMMLPKSANQEMLYCKRPV
jgi:N-acetylglutamate synthase-like GNAT family acetyltransferase